MMKQLLSLLVLVGAAQLSHGCSCFPTHPQEHFCTSDTVFLATAGNRTEHPTEYRASYDLVVHKIFKNPSDPEAYFSEHAENNENVTHITLMTAIHSPMCGVSLSPGVKYILAGNVYEGRVSVNNCGLILQYDSLTRKQMQGFNGKFALNCDCKAEYCMGNMCNTGGDDPDKCRQDFWEMAHGCLDQYARCQRDKETGRCEWTNNRANRICQSRGQRRHRRV